MFRAPGAAAGMAARLADFELSEAARIGDVGDGSFVVSLVGGSTGTFNLRVSVLGDPVPGSPFRTTVCAHAPCPTQVTDWDFLGPYPTGNSLIDGDPLEAYGGITAVSAPRVRAPVSFPSEFFERDVGWRKLKPNDAGAHAAPPRAAPRFARLALGDQPGGSAGFDCRAGGDVMPAGIMPAKLSMGLPETRNVQHATCATCSTRLAQRAACNIWPTTGYLEAKFNVGLPNDVIDFKQLVDQMHTLGVVTMQAACRHATSHSTRRLVGPDVHGHACGRLGREFRSRRDRKARV
jgi:hypothetical protein